MEKHGPPLSTIFGRTNKLINDALEETFKDQQLNMSVIEFALLYRLSTIAEDEITQKHFASIEGKHKSVIMRQIYLMEQKHWVVRMTDNADKRKSMVSLTKMGIGVLNKALLVEKEMMRERIAGISDSDMETFTKVALSLQMRLGAPAKNKAEVK